MEKERIDGKVGERQEKERRKSRERGETELG